MAEIIELNLGSVATGVLQLASGVALDTTLRAVTDQAGTASPLQLSTSYGRFVGNGRFGLEVQGSRSAGLYFGDISNSEGAVWSNKLTPSDTNYSFYVSSTYLGLNSPSTQGIYININGSGIGRFVNEGLYLGTGAVSATSRLHVRGDGTNPIARFENSTGIGSFVVSNAVNASLSGVQNPVYSVISSNGSNFGITFGIGNFGNRAEFSMGYSLTNFAIVNGAGWTGLSMVNGTGERNAIIIGNNGINSTSGTSRLVIQDSIAEAVGALNFRTLNIAYTINNSGAQSGTATGIYLNATETNLNGMAHNLLDLQVGGVSRFKIRNDGRIDCLNIVSTGNVFASYFGVTGGLVGLSATASGVLLVNDAASTSFSRMMLGGTTNLFPAIKRNGAAIDFRLADDSGFAAINSGSIGCNSNLAVTTSMSLGGQAVFGSNDLGSLIASAVLEARSTTRGFLPPRMNTAQINLIGTPAEGLVVFNTTISHLCVYQGGAWVKLNHSPM